LGPSRLPSSDPLAYPRTLALAGIPLAGLGGSELQRQPSGEPRHAPHCSGDAGPVRSRVGRGGACTLLMWWTEEDIGAASARVWTFLIEAHNLAWAVLRGPRWPA
jgi:hypothetical protein